MVRQWQSVFVALVMLLPLIEAVENKLELGMRAKTKDEIMAGMTLKGAMNLVLSLNGTRKDPALASLVEQAGASVQHGKIHQHGEKKVALRGGRKDDALDKAINMLNNMTSTAQENLDLERARCSSLNTSMMTNLRTLQNEVSRHNAMAAAARGMVIIADGNIRTITGQLKDTKIQFRQHKRQCIQELNALNAELLIVESDLKVMTEIITMIDCSGNDAAGAGFFQNPVQIALDEPMMETKEMPVGGVNVSDVPAAVSPYVCSAPPCRIPRGGCQRLKDRFLVVNAGISDRKREVNRDIRNKDQYCTDQTTQYEAQITGYKTRIESEKGDLAIGTQKQNENEEGSHQKSKQHKDISARYTMEMTTCCDNQNREEGTVCALEKIKVKVGEIQGDDAGFYFVDCQVSDWTDEECSVTCGGGILKRTRTVITQPQGGGVKCPPLSTLMVCNDFECPRDCVMSDWDGWSACTAECNGGVREKTRTIQSEESFGGNPCEDTTATESCNVQDCSADCVLSEWSEWSACSKMCQGGSQKRTKYVKVASIGDGQCWGEKEAERLEFKDCNAFECRDMITDPGRQTVMCASNVDVIILLDGSASLGSSGWATSCEITSNLLKAFGGEGTQARVAVELFSGPDNWPDYEACTGESNEQVTDLKTQCGIEWVGKRGFMNGTQEINAMAKTVGEFTDDDWPRSTTLTSVALGECESTFFYGRSDVRSVAVVITDGWPMSQERTKEAAEKLATLASIVWVPVGGSAPIKLIEEMASAPVSDHVVQINTFADLETPQAINKIISTVCPRVA